MPFKTALRQRAGFASHWSTSHTQYWSALRYGVFATQHEPHVDVPPLPWTSDGRRLDLYAESQEPWNAHALRARREASERAHEAGRPAKRRKGTAFGKLDFTALVVAEQLGTPSAVMEYVQTHGPKGMHNFVHKAQKRLAEHIAEALAWHHAATTAAAERETEWDVVLRLAGGSCTCGTEPCRWLEAAKGFLDRSRSTIDGELFAATLAKVIRFGPSKKARVLPHRGPDEHVQKHHA